MSKKTTKVAKCPTCSKFHLIASIDHYNKNKDTQKEFMNYMKSGYEILNTTTIRARNGFDTHGNDCP